MKSYQHVTINYSEQDHGTTYRLCEDEGPNENLVRLAVYRNGKRVETKKFVSISEAIKFMNRSRGQAVRWAKEAIIEAKDRELFATLLDSDSRMVNALRDIVTSDYPRISAQAHLNVYGRQVRLIEAHGGI